MKNPLHAEFCADLATQHRVSIVHNERIAQSTYRLRFEAPELAQRITPGQFVMVRLSGCDDPILGRPFALYDTVLSDTGDAIGLDIVYLVLGKMTARLSAMQPGQQLDVWGPLGNGFTPSPAAHLLLVAGGIGQTPFPAVAQEALGQRVYGHPPRFAPRAESVTLLYGARNFSYLAGLDDFERIGVRLQISTDDGSRGHHGFVTDLLKFELANSQTPLQVLCCGPEPMMEKVAEICDHANAPCQVSLETPMACGIGICFSCVAKVRDAAGEWDYKRTCVEGPVFEASRIEW
ncbi:MAG: dihydroorotate dehydrogenase electron transfer subunit [Planctomycetes bacterium]|nr:dihydroorotate dehydrogenase electron transfer subunit [Planctomycetota bacterium]